jgi:hypothetical protein
MPAASASILSLVAIFGPYDKVFYTVVYSVIFISTLTPITSNATNLIRKYVFYSLNLSWTTAMKGRVFSFHCALILQTSTSYSPTPPPFTGKFFRRRHLALYSVSLIFLKNRSWQHQQFFHKCCISYDDFHNRLRTNPSTVSSGIKLKMNPVCEKA